LEEITTILNENGTRNPFNATDENYMHMKKNTAKKKTKKKEFKNSQKITIVIVNIITSILISYFF